MPALAVRRPVPSHLGPSVAPSSGGPRTGAFPHPHLSVSQAEPMLDWCHWCVAPSGPRHCLSGVTAAISLSVPSLMKPPPTVEASSSMVVAASAV